MQIEDAVSQLRNFQAAGANNIIFVAWTADDFNRFDDPEWARDVAFAERTMDWFFAHTALQALIDSAEDVV